MSEVKASYGDSDATGIEELRDSIHRVIECEHPETALKAVLIIAMDIIEGAVADPTRRLPVLASCVEAMCKDLNIDIEGLKEELTV